MDGRGVVDAASGGGLGSVVACAGVRGVRGRGGGGGVRTGVGSVGSCVCGGATCAAAVVSVED